MTAFFELLRRNRNYRYTWMGQVVSEVGDHFNNIAVFSLALAHTQSGLAVTGVMLSRAMHVLTVVVMALLWALADLPALYLAGVAFVAALRLVGAW